MGFSPQSGLENATRHGDLDPFAVLFLMDRLGWTTAQARERLLSEGGLAGISGIPGGDVRDLEKASQEGEADATLALETFAYEVRKTVGAFAAAMGGLDAIVFTGGIGENSARLRRAGPERSRVAGSHRRPVPEHRLGRPRDLAGRERRSACSCWRRTRNSWWRARRRGRSNASSGSLELSPSFGRSSAVCSLEPNRLGVSAGAGLAGEAAGLGERGRRGRCARLSARPNPGSAPC